MRLFLAQAATLFDYPGVQEQFSPCLRGHWRLASSLHATVLFFGERFSTEEIIEKVAACGIVPGSAFIKGLGRFDHNRIFYAAAEHPVLAEGYRQLSAVFDMPPQRPYIPHVTLMRYRRIDIGCYEKARMAAEEIIAGKLEGPLRLMGSQLTPAGAVYRTLHQF